MNGKARFLDPLYGRITLSHLETEIAFSPEMQRLRYIRLCNINSLMVVGASEVNRFEHAIGVLRLANDWLDAHRIPGVDANDFRAAALLHDFQTGPFGHSIQYVLEDSRIDGGFEHEDVEKGRQRRYYQDITANASFAGLPFRAAEICRDRWKHVSDLIRGEGKLGSLISGTIDLDNIDNVVRLAYHTGITEEPDAGVARDLARDIFPSPEGLQVSGPTVPKIERWQQIRRRLYELLLLDWAEFSGKAMLTRAFEDAVRYGLVGADSWRLTDEELMNVCEHGSVGEAQSVKNLAWRLRTGNLYSPVVLLRTPAVDLYSKITRMETKRELEKEIRDSVYGKKTGRAILVHPILDWKKTDRSVDVLVRETSRRLTVGTDSKTLLLGVFSSARASSGKEQTHLRDAAIRALQRFGFSELKDLIDPMDESSKDGSTSNEGQMAIFR
ncbi:MAG: HD domain-containing protein [bacterium]